MLSWLLCRCLGTVDDAGVQDKVQQTEYDLQVIRNTKRTNPSSNAYLRKALTIEVLLFAVVKAMKRSVNAHVVTAKAEKDGTAGSDAKSDDMGSTVTASGTWQCWCQV